MITLQYIPQREIAHLSINMKIKKILQSVKQDKILLIDAKLKPEEQSELIKKTMEEINKKFKGVEICTIEGTSVEIPTTQKFKGYLANKLLGFTTGLTIVGPAHIIKDIKKDPNKIEILTVEKKKIKRRK